MKQEKWKPVWKQIDGKNGGYGTKKGNGYSWNCMIPAPGGGSVSKSFSRKRDAENWIN